MRRMNATFALVKALIAVLALAALLPLLSGCGEDTLITKNMIAADPVSQLVERQLAIADRELLHDGQTNGREFAGQYVAYAKLTAADWEKASAITRDVTQVLSKYYRLGISGQLTERAKAELVVRYRLARSKIEA